ncbi:unnamed protein product, partial [marine sediment metagenome]
ANGLRLVTFLEDVIPEHPSPAQLNRLFDTIPEIKYFGHWMTD